MCTSAKICALFYYQLPATLKPIIPKSGTHNSLLKNRMALTIVTFVKIAYLLLKQQCEERLPTQPWQKLESAFIFTMQWHLMFEVPV